MPVEFLTDEEADSFGRFDGLPSRRWLARFCLLGADDLERVASCRGDSNQLGFAMQLATVRAVGRFLPDPTDVPWPLVDFVAEQLGVVDSSVVKAYTARLQTVYEHQWQIRAEYGYRDFGSARDEVVAFLDARAATRQESARSLFAAATGWLRDRKVLLPGVSVLARLVSERRAAVGDALHELIVTRCDAADPELRARLDALLVVPLEESVSTLERLRRGPDRASRRQMQIALRRVRELAGFGLDQVDVGDVAPNRLEYLARDGLTSKAPLLRTRASARRSATLFATVRALQIAAIDDVIDVFNVLMTDKLIRPAQRVSRDKQLEALPRISCAARQLVDMGRVVLDARTNAVSVEELFERLDSEVGAADEIEAAVVVVDEIAPVDRDAGWREEVSGRYGIVRGFVSAFVDTIPFRATPAGEHILAGFVELPSVMRRARRDHVPIDIVREELLEGSWRSVAVDDRGVRVAAYSLCVLEALWRALRRRDIHVAGSSKWADPHAELLAGDRWHATRSDVLGGLGLTSNIDKHLADLTRAVDTAWRELAERVDNEPGPVTITVDANDRSHLHLERLAAVPEPDSLIELRELTAAMLPHIDLPDLIMEVHAWTGFLDDFVHISGDTRLHDLALTVAAVMIAEACNIGFTPVADSTNPALSTNRLHHVDQNYVRADTIRSANARLVAAQADIALAQLWGGGLVASIDGLRFVVPVRTINAGANPRYFGRKRGTTWLNAVNDHTMGIGAQLVPGTERDSLHTLDVVLNPDGGPVPEVVTTDTASYSDLVFGLFQICGIRFAPRIADLTTTRFWRLDPSADYGPLNNLARHRTTVDRIRTHWEDMLRISGSLTTGTVRAYDLIRAIGRDGRPTPLGHAIVDYGRLAKTLHLLAVTDPDDDSYRRAMQGQLNSHEGRHRIARKVFYGRRGELRQKYRDGQEDQLGLLGLLVNACTLWTTRYLDAALQDLEQTGHPVHDADAERLSPLQEDHLGVLGRYTFTPHTSGTLRPLRDPAATDTLPS